MEKKEKNIRSNIKFLKNENRAIAIDENKIVGVCEFIEKDESKWNIVHTEVDKKYQGQGIAKKLVECVIEESKKNNKKLVADCSYAKKILQIN